MTIFVPQDGRTALHFASYSGHMSCVELLTNAGSALNVQDKVCIRAINVM